MKKSDEKTLTAFGSLIETMRALRSPGGCPWDLEQDEHTLKTYLIEECYELMEALDKGSHREVLEELGDLLMQVIFLGRIFEERGSFVIEDIARTINEKMLRRHPHVFGGDKASTSREVLENWERIKMKEKEAHAGGEIKDKKKKGLLSSVPSSLPALLQSYRLGEKASAVGFDWKSEEGVMDKLEEEWREFKVSVAGGKSAEIEEEMGDMLFTLVNLSRFKGINPEEALRQSNRKFRERFEYIEKRLEESGRELGRVDFKSLDELWEEAKRVFSERNDKEEEKG